MISNILLDLFSWPNWIYYSKDPNINADTSYKLFLTCLTWTIITKDMVIQYSCHSISKYTYKFPISIDFWSPPYPTSSARFYGGINKSDIPCMGSIYLRKLSFKEGTSHSGLHPNIPQKIFPYELQKSISNDCWIISKSEFAKTELHEKFEQWKRDNS